MTTLLMEHFKISRFPNGEYGVKIDADLHPENHQPITLKFKWPDPFLPDLMLPILMGRAIKQTYARPVILQCPYLPYLRQDRAFQHGDVAAANIIVEMLSDTFMRIDTLEPHCNVSEKVVGFCFMPTVALCQKEVQFVAPDQNAPVYYLNTLILKKTRISLPKNIVDIKLECPVHVPTLKKAIILDDLCDGGRTFTTCAALLRELGYEQITLAVAHGIFSQGINVLFENGIDQIITTDSFCRLSPIPNKLIILDAFEAMRFRHEYQQNYQ